MAIKVECTHCAAVLNLKDESKVGKRIKCPKCQQPFTITVSSEDEFSGEDEEEFVDLQAEEPAPQPARSGKGKAGAKGTSGTKSKGKGKGKSKKKPESGGMLVPLLIGGGVLAVLLIGGLVFFLTRGGDAPAVAEKAAAADVPREAQVREKKEAPVKEPVTVEAAPSNSINTQYLLKETQFVIHLKPAILLKSPILQRVLKTDFGKNALASFVDQYGFGLEAVEELTIGVAPDLNEIANYKPQVAANIPVETKTSELSDSTSTSTLSDPTMQLDAAGVPPAGMSNPSMASEIPKTPKTIIVMRTSVDIDLTKAKFISPLTATTTATDTLTMDLSSSIASSSGDSSSSDSTSGEPSVNGAGNQTESNTANQFYSMRMPGSGPQFKLSMPDKKTMVAGEEKYLKEVVANKTSVLDDKFSFVSIDESFVIAGLLEFVPFVRQSVQSNGGNVPENAEKLFKLYDQGAQSGYLSLQLNDGVSIKSGLVGKDEAAGKAIQTEFASLEQVMKKDFASQESGLPPGFQKPLKETVEALKVVQDKNAVYFETKLTAALFDEVQTQAQQFGGQMAMAMAQGMLASKLGPGFAPGGMGGPDGLLPADMGAMPLDSLAVLEGEPVSATTATGLPEGVELAALLSLDPALPQGVNVNLVLKGQAENVVQYKSMQLTDSTWDNGDVVKTARAKPVKFSTSQTWDHTDSFKLKGTAETITVVPAPIYLSPSGQSVAKLQGDVTVQSATKVDVLEVDLANPDQFASPEIEAAGIRIIASGDKDSVTYYILPAIEGVAVVSVELVGETKDSQGQITSFPSAAMETPSSDEANAAQFAETSANSAGENAVGKETVQAVEKVLGVSRPQYTNPVGFVIAFEKQKASIVSIRVASGLTEHEVHFEFENLPVPPAPVVVASTDKKEPVETPKIPEPLPVWTSLAEGTAPTEGFTRIEATGIWEPFVEDSKTQNLNITLDLVGPAAEMTISVLRYGVDECLAEDDKKLVFVEKADSLKSQSRVERIAHAAKTPLNTYRVTLPFNAVNPTFSSLKSLKGELRLQIADKQVSVNIDSLKEYEGKRILQPDLLKEKVFLDATIDEETKELILKLDAKSGTRVDSLVLLNDAGQRQPDIPQTLSVDEKGTEIFRFNIGEKSIKEIGLQVIIFQGGTTVRIPFNFTDMPLPPAPVEE